MDTFQGEMEQLQWIQSTYVEEDGSNRTNKATSSNVAVVNLKIGSVREQMDLYLK